MPRLTQTRKFRILVQLNKLDKAFVLVVACVSDSLHTPRFCSLYLQRVTKDCPHLRCCKALRVRDNGLHISISVKDRGTTGYSHIFSSLERALGYASVA